VALSGYLPTRWGDRPGTGFPYGGFEASDGAVAIVCLEPSQWDALARWVAEVTGEEAILDEQYRGALYMRQPHVHYLAYLVTELTRRFTKHELFHEGQRRGIPVLPVAHPKDVLTDPHLADAGFFRTVAGQDGVRYQLPGVPFRSPAWGDRPDAVSPATPPVEGSAAVVEGLAPRALVVQTTGGGAS
jgi:crotonobetainyl-CoA:carnitine CoA-transferase CaiB-like acyl-CoA transferase